MSRIEDNVCEKIQKRAEVGLKKYGVSMADEILSVRQWLVHLQEELMDATVYLEKLMGMLDLRALDYDLDKWEDEDNG